MNDLKASLEAILFAAGEPVSAARLSLVLAVPETKIFASAEELAREYESEGRGVRLLRMENRLQLCSAPAYADLIVKTLEQRRPPMLSSAALEVLSVVAYYQPATRALVEKMRGVDSSYSISLLQERGLIEACGRLEAPGRPTLYATTDSFLRVMGIHSLQELPPLPEAQGSEGTEQLRKSIEKLQERDSDGQQNLFTEHERKQTEE